MNCPKCGKLLEARISNYPDKQDYVEVEVACENKHLYWCRIKEEDLIEDIDSQVIP